MPRQKLTDAEVALLRSLYAERMAALAVVQEITVAKLAEKFELSHASVSRIGRGVQCKWAGRRNQ